MQEWSIGVLVLAVALASVLRLLPWRRARSIRVESRIGTAAVHFDPLPPDAKREAPPTRTAPKLPASRPRKKRGKRARAQTGRRGARLAAPPKQPAR